ncbi:MAG: hypothetical protein OFPII_06720 [Osedax symbiont Rs1]|nr:MAG: hypothetical protein OFPII_06720 [Osedax symbiont Rs1]
MVYKNRLRILPQQTLYCSEIHPSQLIIHTPMLGLRKLTPKLSC